MSHSNSLVKNNTIKTLITDNIDLWTSAIKKRNATGRGSNKKIELTGIKKLRELILELAVRGKLVSQDANDEPASVLLEKIAKEKAQLIADKKIKKQKPLPEITEEEKPFELPVGWEFVRFIDVLDFSGGGQPPKSVFSEEKLDGYIQLIQIRDLGPNPQPVYIPKDRASKFCTENDIMVGRYGASVGKVFWGKEGAYNVALIRIHNDLNSYYNGFVFQLLKSPLGQKLFTGISRSAQDGFNKDDIAPSLLPLPPLAEQHRIVAKVDELMVLCDQLEQQTEQSLSAHQTLVEVLLGYLFKPADGSATASESANDLTAMDGGNEGNAGAISFQTSWQRIAEHFDLLFTTEASIEQLKQTILQLAVMGKLVPQNPSDKPASVLLEKIAKEKAQKIAAKMIKKHPEVDPIGPNVRLPGSWESIVVQDFADIKLGSTPSRTEMNYWNGDIPWVSSGEVAKNLILDTKEKITQAGFDNSSAPLIPARSLLMAIIGQGKTRGQTALLGIDACTNQNVAAFVFNENHVVPEFIQMWAQSKYDDHRGDGRGGAQPALNGKMVRSFKFPLPPTAEQHRIVAKVNEIMALCEQLKARLSDAQTTQLHLADTVVEQALN